jgi:hypothetical protein
MITRTLAKHNGGIMLFLRDFRLHVHPKLLCTVLLRPCASMCIQDFHIRNSLNRFWTEKRKDNSRNFLLSTKKTWLIFGHLLARKGLICLYDYNIYIYSQQLTSLTNTNQDVNQLDYDHDSTPYLTTNIQCQQEGIKDYFLCRQIHRLFLCSVSHALCYICRTSRSSSFAQATRRVPSLPWHLHLEVQPS